MDTPMTEKWFIMQKGADFTGIGEKFGIHPVIARLIRNREVVGETAIEKYLHGSLQDMYDPHLLKDADRLVEILQEKLRQKKKIRIIGDYDIDGVMSTYILYQGIRRCGGAVDTKIPDRIKDGYGINEHLIREAFQDGIDTIVTCDNGIAAIPEIAIAKELGMTVLVTDHHEIPYIEENGKRIYQKSQADAIVNPKQQECNYPFKELCGAAVVYKVIQILFERCGQPADAVEEFLENAAFATVGDVMELKDENRILVKEGLKRLHGTTNPGMRALIRQNHLEPQEVNAYHIGFVLGPCVNASGRLETAKIALRLFLEEDEAAAAEIARELVELNLQRKEMTTEGIALAKAVVEEKNAGDKVMVIYLPDVHESLAGIIAGRIRETYHRPVFVLTRSEDGVKGSGRSIEEYSMYEELCKCREYFTRFGGHPMAAGISLKEEDVNAFREKINAYCELTEEDFIPKIRIDIAMPAAYPNAELIRELAILEPFGKGNQKPQFADRGLSIKRAWVVGKNQNVLRLSLLTGQQESVSAVYFGDVEKFKAYYAAKFGEAEVEAAFRGQENQILMSIVYYPEINSYQGIDTIQLTIRNYQ
jgi:single-stranded-DNA-specific exonuclease